MTFKVLESSVFKDKYFYRTQKWDWLTHEMIYIVDGARMITMDYWPQQIFLEADGQRTVSEFIYFIASKYPKAQIPENLDAAIIEELTALVTETKIVELSDTPVSLNDLILNPLTEEGKVDMMGTWLGIYSYNLPEEFKDERTQAVEFTIEIKTINGNNFEGSVEDNLATGGTPGIGKIQGTFSDYEISFEKNMPVYARIEHDKSHIINENKKHPSLLYQGEFSRSKLQVSGTWKFKKKILVWYGIIPRWITPGHGSFTMKKIEKK